MRVLGVFRKALREAKRDKLVVALTVAFAPFFVFLAWLAFPALAPSFRLLVVDEDRGGGGAELRATLAATKDASGKSLVEVVPVATREEATRQLERKEAAALVVVPPDFSDAVGAVKRGEAPPQARLVLSGDLTHPTYAVTAVLASAGLDSYLQQATNRRSPLEVVEEPLGGSGSRTDFELYVPGILVFAVILLVFQAAMAVARDVESGTLRRLQQTRMTSFDYLVGTSAVLVLVALLSVAVTFGCALALGFRSQGPLWVALLVTVVTAVSIVGVGLMVAAFSRTVAQAFVIANFPLGLLMFFSGAMFPMPRVTLFTVAGHPLGPFEVLPPTHAVAALNKVFTLGAGLADVAFELAMVVLLSAAYFAVGVVLLRRLRMRAA